MSNRNSIKTWVKSSGIYTDAKTIALDLLLSSSKTESDNPTPQEGAPQGKTFFEDLHDRLSDPNDELAKLMNKIVTPQFLEKSVNTLADAGYDWLEGKTDQPTFQIKLVENKADFAEFLAIMFKEKARGLPPCEKTYKIPANFDPINTQCWPVGHDYNEITQFIQQNSSRPEFDTLYQKTQIDQSIFSSIDPQTTQKVHTIYALIQWEPAFFVGIILLFVFVIILLTPGFKNGLIPNGIVMSLAALGWIGIQISGIASSQFIFSRLPATMNSSTTLTLLKPYLMKIIDSVSQSLFTVILIVSTSLLLLGIGLIVLRFRKFK